MAKHVWMASTTSVSRRGRRGEGVQYCKLLTISREDSIFLLKYKDHMIHGMPRRVMRFQRGTLNLEGLAILDVRLSLVRLVLVNSRLRTKFEKIRDPLDMVLMPMCYEGVAHRGLLLLQHGPE